MLHLRQGEQLQWRVVGPNFPTWPILFITALIVSAINSEDYHMHLCTAPCNTTSIMAALCPLTCAQSIIVCEWFTCIQPPGLMMMFLIIRSIIKGTMYTTKGDEHRAGKAAACTLG